MASVLKGGDLDRLKELESVKAVHTWGYLYANDSIRGNADGWRLAKGPEHNCLINENNPIIIKGRENPGIEDMLLGQRIQDTTPIWVSVPIAANGWRTFLAAVTHSLDVSCQFSAYLMPSVDGTLAQSPTLIDVLYWAQVLVDGVELPRNAEQGRAIVTPGGEGRENFSQAPAGHLVMKIEPLGVPTIGQIRIGVERQQ